MMAHVEIRQFLFLLFLSFQKWIKWHRNTHHVLYETIKSIYDAPHMTCHVHHAHHGMPMVWAIEEKLVLSIFTCWALGLPFLLNKETLVGKILNCSWVPPKGPQ
jgi:hypothetical protein